MTETVKRYRVSGYGNGMIEAEDGVWCHEDDFARLEQERAGRSAQVDTLTKWYSNSLDTCRALEQERDAALSQAACLRELLTRCKEHLDPHRDAALWSDVCAALGPKP